MKRRIDELVLGIARATRGLDLPAEPAHPFATDITDDSRAVAKGSIFVARRGGTHDGNAYIPAAIAAGASAIVTDDPDRFAAASDAPSDVPIVLVDDAARDGARLAERFFGDPSRNLHISAVTGTNGKTTVATLTRQLLQGVGVRCGLVGTIEIAGVGAGHRATLTTPGAIELSRTLAGMVADGCTACALEASSHALDQGRLAAIHVDAAAYTNLTGDHLDYHGTMDRYADAKAILFERLDPDATAIFNTLDPAWTRMARDCSALTIRCGPGEEADATVLAADLTGTTVRLRGPFGVLTVRVPLIGAHNAMNLLQAATIASTFGLDAHDLAQAAQSITPPTGRLERVAGPDHAPTVLVDFAHTDDALERSLAAVRASMAAGRLIAVFGCGGDRDRSKRPRMAAAAERHADRVIITSDNPRTENPTAIIAEVASGLSRPDAATREVDREAAIEQAIAEARPDDVIVIAGKGHETEQILPDGAGGTRRIHLDDAEIARRALEARAAPIVRTRAQQTGSSAGRSP